MIKIGVIQICSGIDPNDNLKKIESFLKKSAIESCRYVFLPECFLSMSDGLVPTPYAVTDESEILSQLSGLAEKFGINILGGSIATKSKKSGDKKLKNKIYHFLANGDIVSKYQKIHLFNRFNKIDSSKTIDESTIYQSGDQLSLFEFEKFIVGENICFDLRFSNQAYEYRKMGANILIYPSAFTVETGKAHWHTLLRGRAIETQTFVIASAQWGVHNQRISTYGHSLVVDPWGKVLLDMKEGESIQFVDLDLSLIDKVRENIPMIFV